MEFLNDNLINLGACCRFRTGITSTASGNEPECRHTPTSKGSRRCDGTTRRGSRRRLQASDTILALRYFPDFKLVKYFLRLSGGGGDGSGEAGGSGDFVSNNYAVEYAKSSRAKCRACEDKIEKVEGN